MATRNYQGVQLPSMQGATPQAQSASAVVQQNTQIVPSNAALAVKGLLGAASELAGQKFEQSVQEHYLRGQIAESTGQSVENVEADTAMKPFVRGGYADAAWSAEQAKLSSAQQTLIASQQGAQLTPEQFAAQLSGHNKALTEQIKGLPAARQISALQQQVQLNDALVKAHTKVHAKYNVDQYANSVSTQGNEIAMSILKARKDGDTETELSHMARAGQYVSMVMSDPKLTDKSRHRVVTDYLTMLAGSDVRQVPEFMRDSGLLNRLSSKQLEGISRAITQSKARTAATDQLGELRYQAEFESRIKNGDITDPEEVAQYVEHKARNGATPAAVMGVWKSYFTGGNSGYTNAQIVTALQSRNLVALDALLPPGTSRDKAIDIYGKMLAKAGVGTAESTSAQVAAGLGIGVLPKSLGRNVGAAITQIAATPPGDQVDSGLMGTLSGVVTALGTAEKNNPAAGAVLLNSLPKESQAVVGFMLENRGTMDPVSAIRLATTRLKDAAKLSPEEQAAASKKLMAAVNAEVDKQWSNGGLGKVWGASVGNGLDRALNFITGSQSNVNSVWNNTSIAGAVRQEVQDLARDPNAVALLGADGNTAATVKRAYAAVMERTIPVGTPNRLGGKNATAFILRQGMTIPDAFPGLETSDGPALGQAMAKLNPFGYKLPEGHMVGYRMDTAGNIWATELDGSGEPVYSGDRQTQTVLAKSQVGGLIKDVAAQRDKVWEDARRANFGGPIKVQAHEGGEVTLNVSGANPIGVNPLETMRWKREVLSAEGMRTTVYSDSKGPAAGVGHNDPSLKVGQAIPHEQINQWFAQDTNAAMLAGKKLANQLGVYDDRGILGIAGMIFQHGEKGLKNWDRTLKMIAEPKRFTYDQFKKEAQDSDTWRNPATRKRVDRFIWRMKDHWSN